MKSDIENRKDIYLIVSEFYKKLLDDPEMIHFFEDFKDKNHLEEHLAVLVDFWDSIIFYSGTYTRNAMQPHLSLQKRKPFEEFHFKKWLKHFTNSIDTYFEGPNAHNAKSRALSIATVMQIKIADLNKL